jgi:hypothetical protein
MKQEAEGENDRERGERGGMVRGGHLRVGFGLGGKEVEKKSEKKSGKRLGEKLVVHHCKPITVGGEEREIETTTLRYGRIFLCLR